MVPSPSRPWSTPRTSQWLAKLTWKLWGCVSMAQKVRNLQAGSSLLRGVLLWQPSSSCLLQQLCEHEAKDIPGDSAWYSSARKLQQGDLVAPVWGINTSPTHSERAVAEEILVFIVLWWWGAAVPAEGCSCAGWGIEQETWEVLPATPAGEEGRKTSPVPPASSFVQQLHYKEQRPLILPVFFDLQFSQL